MREIRGFVLGVLLFAAVNNFVAKPLSSDLSSNFARCRSAIGEVIDGRNGFDPCRDAAGKPVARGALFLALGGLTFVATSRRNRLVPEPALPVAPMLRLVVDDERRVS